MPVGDDPAGAAHDGNQRGDIPWVHDGIDRDIDESGGQHEVTITVGPRAVEPGLGDEAVTRCPVLILGEIEVVAGDQGGLGELGGGTAAGGP